MSIADKIDVEKVVESLQNFKTKLFKSELFKIGFVVFFGLILLLFILPFFLDNSGIKFQIEQKISQTYGANFTINGDVKVALFPSPKVIAKDVLLQNYQPKDIDHKESEKAYNFYAKAVEIKLPVFQFISGGLIKEIIFTDAIAEEHYSKNKLARVDKFSEAAAKFIKNDGVLPVKNEGGGISATLLAIDDIDMSQISSSHLPDFIVKNGTAIFYDKSSSKKEFSAINIAAQISEEKIMASGGFVRDKMNSNFKLLAKFNVKSPTYKSSFELSSSAIDLKINGNFTSENKGLTLSDFKGKIEGEILDLKSFYKSYISDNSVIFNKIRAGARAIKISADINNSAGEIKLKDLEMSSVIINGKGGVELDLSSKIPMIDLSFDLDYLDLDEIWSSESVKVSEVAREEDIKRQAGLIIEKDAIDKKDEAKKDLDKKNEDKKDKDVSVIIVQDLDKKDVKPQEKSHKTSDLENNLNFINKIKNFDLTSEIKIKNVKYADGEIKDVDLYLTVSSEGQILVLPLIFRTPGDGLFRVNGVFDNDKNSAKFVGKFDASGKALQEILKWMRIESQNLKFENLREYSIYSDVLLLPNSASLNNFYLNLNSGQNEFLGEVKIINNEKVVNISNKFRISDFNMDDYFLTSGSNIYLSPGSLIKKLFWLNNIPANNELELNFDKLTYKGEEFSNQSIKARFGRGYFVINNLHLLSETTDLNIDLNVDISDKNPRFDLKIIANNFDYQTIQNNEKPDDVNKVGKRNFIDQFYALPSLEGLDGKIFFSFENLTLDEIDIENIKLAGKLKDGGVDISEFTFDIYGGTIGYKGLLGIKSSKIINGNLSLSDVSLQPLLSDLFGINNISGVINVSSSLTSAADRKEDFVKELIGELKFSTNAPSIAGYGLNDLVKKMFSPQVYASELVDSEKILFNPEGNTIFKEASGVFQINGNKESKLRITTSATALNGVLSGKIDLANNKIDALLNVIFLTGNLQKPTPINIATNLKGDLSAISQSSNIDQIRQYLGLEKTTLIVPQVTQDQVQISPSIAAGSGDNNMAPKENNSRQSFEMMDVPQNEKQNKP